MRKQLIKGGIDASRLSSAGFGKENSIGDNFASKSKVKNRKVELINNYIERIQK
jgi:outer membrane protein OmpA-like peptidoglycan-associated protein